MLRQTLFAVCLSATTLQNSFAAPLTYSDVMPILVGRCVMCHVPDGLMGPPPEGYRLDSYQETLSTADRARVVPGNALASELYRRIIGYARPRMPLNGPPYLSGEEIERVAQWINDGALDANGNPAPEINGAKVRLHGSLTAQWELDGLPVKVHSGTRIKKSPDIGSYVRVRGQISNSGEVIAERIKRR
jgi:mono/diheme cytochrome c family protein